MRTTALTSTTTAPGDRSRTATVLALARVEAGQLLRHPAFLGGLAATLAVLLQSRTQWMTWDQTYYLNQIAWTGLWLGTLAAAALVAGRQRFLAEPDLFPATPTTPADRALATAVALIGPTLVAAAMVAAVAFFVVNDGGFVQGDEGYSRRMAPTLAEWVQPVLLVALAGVVGLAVAQLRRGRLAALLVILFATFVGGMLLWAFQGNAATRVFHPHMHSWEERKLPHSFAPEGWAPNDPPLLRPNQWSSHWREVHFSATALEWHLVYLTGLILVVLWLAMRWADRTRAPARWVIGVGALLVLVGSVAQLVSVGGG